MKSTPKILVCVTAYEDPEAVASFISAIKNQSTPVEKILIVDNSNDKKVCLQPSVNNSNLEVIYSPENLGVSGSLKIAYKRLFSYKYDFLWTFDQDSIPAFSCLENLLKVYREVSQNNYKVGIIAPLSIDLRNNNIIEGANFVKDHFAGCQHQQKKLYECDAPITSGTLISLTTAKTISIPREDLFIDGIDLDYGLRLKQAGYHNFIVTDAIMHHNFGHPSEIKFINRNLLVQKYPPIRHYYICRNHTYLETRYAQGLYKVTSSLKRIKYLIFTIIKIILFDHEYKNIKIWACLLGTFHGFIGKLGKLWH
ncbi:glycosyltransferase [Nostoc sp. FACHB-152]|uniref:glycosyltransferase n=1 Tax=unclassified Nostoc TaxID=2593658 RepID=UPI00168733FF|nr:MULTISPECIES: glycosyltransferase [unclassified Nostoc]MBD2445885.1 glycosyltransferase [Nostoc sp. FACHB-152]MBD2467939.1 glycosyltransferase [Nostoc sp. FACHB-145]